MPDDAWDVIMKIHVRAPFRLIRAAAPHMRIKGDTSTNRSIVNVSSTSGLHGNVGEQHNLYHVSQFTDIYSGFFFQVKLIMQRRKLPLWDCPKPLQRNGGRME